MKLATTTGDYFDYTKSQEVALERIKKAGFRYADYSFGFDYRNKNGIYSNDYEKYYADVLNTLNRIDVKLVQAHSPLGKPLQDDGSFLSDTLRCVDACGIWGIPNLVVHSGYVAGLSKEQTLEQNKRFFMPLLERAEKYGVNILVENFNKMSIENLYWIDNATDLLDMVNCVNHPLFHVVWDVGHANLQEMPQDQELSILGKHVLGVHIHDNLGDNDSHLVPFLGTLNMDSVMNGLKNIGYNGYFTFEVGSFFLPANKRRQYQKETRLLTAPIEIKDAFERYLYELGKSVLEKYNCFEE